MGNVQFDVRRIMGMIYAASTRILAIAAAGIIVVFGCPQSNAEIYGGT